MATDRRAWCRTVFGKIAHERASNPVAGLESLC